MNACVYDWLGGCYYLLWVLFEGGLALLLSKKSFDCFMGVHLRMSSSSSSIYSSSFSKRILGQTLCFCELEATLKWFTTAKNPRRPFLGCSKYNIQAYHTISFSSG
ncbi:hypothetical protein I3843_14G028600 [Carya illinoinensis]|nr:hypothetical protein I3843_14G028600 [Carya illinoinensis]